MSDGQRAIKSATTSSDYTSRVTAGCESPIVNPLRPWRERTDERFCLMVQTADRLRNRAWQSYLETTRTAESSPDAEPDAWSRLQERLAEIDEELLHVLSAG